MGVERSWSPVLEAALRRCRTACEETLESYRAAGTDPESAFAATLLTVVAAVDVALAAEPARRASAAAAAAQVARGAAERLRRYGLDEQILRCAAACEELAHRGRDEHGD